MRIWRFDKSGVAKNAYLFEDSFVLYGFEESPIYLSQHEVEKLAKSYDFLCLFDKKIFPVLRKEVRTKTKLQQALRNRMDYGLFWSFGN